MGSAWIWGAFNQGERQSRDRRAGGRVGGSGGLRVQVRTRRCLLLQEALLACRPTVGGKQSITVVCAPT